MALGNPSDDLPAYARFLLLFLAEAIVGVALYSLFTRTPVALQMLFFAAAAVVVRLAHYKHPNDKTIASILCGLTLGFAGFCGIVSRITQRVTTLEDVWARLMMVGFCLVAVLMVLDRRL